jgi:hypothetical protein
MLDLKHQKTKATSAYPNKKPPSLTIPDLTPITNAQKTLLSAFEQMKKSTTVAQSKTHWDIIKQHFIIFIEECYKCNFRIPPAQNTPYLDKIYFSNFLDACRKAGITLTITPSAIDQTPESIKKIFIELDKAIKHYSQSSNCDAELYAEINALRKTYHEAKGIPISVNSRFIQLNALTYFKDLLNQCKKAGMTINSDLETTEYFLLSYRLEDLSEQIKSFQFSTETEKQEITTQFTQLKSLTLIIDSIPSILRKLRESLDILFNFRKERFCQKTSPGTPSHPVAASEEKKHKKTYPNIDFSNASNLAAPLTTPGNSTIEPDNIEIRKP